MEGRFIIGSKIYSSIEKKKLKQLHETEMEILDEIKRICEKNNIRYFLVGGSMLGAVRHKGFIPWDDDIDVGMLREDYDKFIECALRDMDKKYFLHCDKTDYNYWLPFIKVKKNNTTFVERDLVGKKVLHKGIFVDIFPFDNTNSSYLFIYIKAFIIKTINEAIIVKTGVQDLKQSRHKVLDLLLSIFSLKTMRRIRDFFVYSNYKKNTKKICAYMGAYHIKKDIYLSKCFEEFIEVPFENKIYPIPKEYDYMLTTLYGDYMKLPKKEDRVNHGVAELSFDKGDNI